MERVAGIEPASSAWKAEVLPLNHTRYILTSRRGISLSGHPNLKVKPGLIYKPLLFHPAQLSKLTQFLLMVEGGGFEPPKLTRQIYSLIPLATREPLRKATYCPYEAHLCQPFPLIKLSTYISFVRTAEIWLPAPLQRFQSSKFRLTYIEKKNGAGERSRTPDRLITNQLLYLLSYASVFWIRN